MTRRVFSNSMVAHVWAQQEVSHGRSNNGNFFFEGPTIYSYGQHFPVAMFAESPATGERAVLFNPDYYSVSTSRHKSLARRAVNGHRVPVFYVPQLFRTLSSWTPEQCFAANLAWFERQIKEARKSAHRARENKFWRLQNLQRLMAAHNGYVQWFTGEEPAFPHHLTPAEQEIIDNRERIEQERREKEAEKLKGRIAEEIESFRSGQGFTAYVLNHAPCMLRLKSENIETSWGASFPASHARLAWAAICYARQRNETVIPSRPVRLGHFTVNSISPEGDVKAGCHTVPYDECKRLAVELGLAQ